MHLPAWDDENFLRIKTVRLERWEVWKGSLSITLSGKTSKSYLWDCVWIPKGFSLHIEYVGVIAILLSGLWRPCSCRGMSWVISSKMIDVCIVKILRYRTTQIAGCVVKTCLDVQVSWTYRGRRPCSCNVSLHMEWIQTCCRDLTSVLLFLRLLQNGSPGGKAYKDTKIFPIFKCLSIRGIMEVGN